MSASSSAAAAPSHDGLTEVTIASVPDVRVISLHAVVENYRAQKQQWQQLFAFCKAHNLSLDGPSRTIYYDSGYKETDVDLEVCLPLHADAQVMPESHEDIKERVLPAIPRAASITLVGPYEELPSAYKKLHAWIKDEQHTIAGPIREVYHQADYANDPAGKSFVTELQLPIA